MERTATLYLEVKLINNSSSSNKESQNHDVVFDI